MINKILSVFVCVSILSCSLIVSVSAATNFTEYYRYNGQAISSSVAEVLSGIAVNSLRQYPDRYRYWASIRIDEYRYAILFFKDLEDYTINSSLMTVSVSDGLVDIYNQRLASYQNGNQTYYQAGLEPTEYFGDFTFQLTRGYVIGNVPGSININAEQEVTVYLKYIPYLLYTLIAFLLLFVAFKFMNKRWLLP